MKDQFTVAVVGFLSAAAAVIAQERPTPDRPAPKPPPRRGYLLPEDRSIGHFLVREKGSKAGEVWEDLVEARGAVLTPPEREVKLAFNESAVADVKLLADFKAESLAGLSLRRLPIKDDDLAFVRHLEGLRELDLSGTGITNEGLKHLETLKQLEVLSLSGTKVTDEGLSAVVRLEKLTILDLPSQITPDGLVRLSERPTLASLSLRGNANLTATDALRGLVALKALGRLDLAESTLTDAAGESLGLCKRLEDVDLSRTGAGDGTLRALSSSRILTHLNLTRTAVTDGGVGALASATSLETLLLGSTKITDAALEAVCSLPLLKRVSLAGTAVTDVGAARLARGSGTLEDLSLQDVKVTDACCGDLERLTGLRRLVLRGTGLTPACRERLKARLSRCAIVN